MNQPDNSGLQILDDPMHMTLIRHPIELQVKEIKPQNIAGWRQNKLKKRHGRKIQSYNPGQIHTVDEGFIHSDHHPNKNRNQYDLERIEVRKTRAYRNDIHHNAVIVNDTHKQDSIMIDHLSEGFTYIPQTHKYATKTPVSSHRASLSIAGTVPNKHAGDITIYGLPKEAKMLSYSTTQKESFYPPVQQDLRCYLNKQIV